MMTDKLPLIRDVHFEQNPERLKIVMPVKRNMPMLLLYGILTGVWLVMMIGGVIYTVQIALSGERYAFVFTIMLAILVLILYRFGRTLRRQFGYYLAGREILYVNNEQLILRRPVSIWGITDLFEMKHISRFYRAEEEDAAAFDYGYHHVYFGQGLTAESQAQLAQLLNQRYLPDRAAADAGAA